MPYSYTNTKKKTWSVEEENTMMKSIRNGDTFDKIAQQHGRTKNAIQLRFGMICKKEIENTPKNLQALSKEYHIQENQLVKYIEDFEKIQTQNQNKLLSPQAFENNSSLDPSDITIIKEEVLLLNEKIDKMYKYVKKIMETIKKTA